MECRRRSRPEGSGRATPPGTHHGAQEGFTLLEMVIALAVAVGLIVAVLSLFQLNRQLAAVQTDRTEMQQAVRAVHLELASRLRMTGRGGLAQTTPAKSWPHAGAVLEVASNVSGAQRVVAPAFADSPSAVEGTDVLTLRGVFEGAVYYGYDNTEDVSYLVLRDAGGSPVADPRNARRGEVHVCATSPAGFPQDVEPLRAAVRSGSEEALILGGSQGGDEYGVVKLDPGASATTSPMCNPGDPDAGVQLAFVVQGDGGRADRYHELAPEADGLPQSLTSVSHVAILDEYRYYLRELRERPGDGDSPLRPRLSRARLYPNTGMAWGTDDPTRRSVVAEDVAHDIFDFQVALGLDSSQGSGALADGSLPAGGDPVHESDDGSDDDWLFNNPDDDPRGAEWQRPGNAVITRPWLRAGLFYVRLTTVGRAGHPVEDYRAPVLGRVEDRVYDASGANDPDSDWERQFHRWVVSTTIDLRNL